MAPAGDEESTLGVTLRTGTFARAFAVSGAALLALTACGGGSSSSGSSGASSGGGGHSGGTFTILANAAFGVADPAQNYTLQEWQLLIDTHDGLVQFKRVGGAPGTELVPDLAT